MRRGRRGHSGHRAVGFSVPRFEEKSYIMRNHLGQMIVWFAFLLETGIQGPRILRPSTGAEILKNFLIVTAV